MRSRGALHQRPQRVHLRHDAQLAAPTRTKTLQVGGLVAVTSALQFAAAAAIGLFLFGSVIVFCALVVGGYYFVWCAHDDNENVKEADTAKDLARLERGLGRAHNGGGLGGVELLARFMLRQFVAAGEKLAAFRRSVLGFSFTVSLADSAPMAASVPPAHDHFEITVIPLATEVPTALMVPTSNSLPPHLKLLPAGGGKEAMTKKKAKKSRRRSKPKDLVTIFTSNLARDTPIKTVQRVAMPPVTPSIPDLMALKPAPSVPMALAVPIPVGKQLEVPSIASAVPLSPLQALKSKLVVPHAELASKPIEVSPTMPKIEVEQHVVPHVETINKQADDMPIEKPEVEPEPVEEPERELPPVTPRKVTLYAKPPSVVVIESLPAPVVVEEQLAVESITTEVEDADFLFAIALDPPTAVAPAEWTRLKPAASSMGNAELREMVEELDAMSREADAALAACSALLASLEA